LVLKNKMECVVCKHGTTYKGHVTVKLERRESIVLFKVPADICENCEHFYLDEHTAIVILNEGEKAIKQGAEFKVVRYGWVA